MPRGITGSPDKHGMWMYSGKHMAKARMPRAVKLSMKSSKSAAVAVLKGFIAGERQRLHTATSICDHGNGKLLDTPQSIATVIATKIDRIRRTYRRNQHYNQMPITDVAPEARFFTTAGPATEIVKKRKPKDDSESEPTERKRRRPQPGQPNPAVYILGGATEAVSSNGWFLVSYKLDRRHRSAVAILTNHEWRKSVRLSGVRNRDHVLATLQRVYNVTAWT